MTRKEQLQAQLAAEAETTRKFIEVFPFNKKDFQVHEKSMKIGDIFLHVLDLASWTEMAVKTDGLDFATAPYNPKELNSVEEAMSYFNESVEKGMNTLENTTDSILDETWILRTGDNIHYESTKEDMIRVAHNQTVHHRAQLGVNYRLLGIPVPPSYGPTADFTDF
ncbi:DinB family protein [Fluviicola taffensis]|uniref:DinB family protein n=1 Tax=Fluviicola taffensis (strain DSM 16823 / NCIMB 13979 / RW262) TaxID=755732 RepID=F2IIF3_FLUTR|nr:DinB family protein [Fluviicola taffensis]AEA44879.1 DinB family protein [Fluviicola taffensis DSM 16823]